MYNNINLEEAQRFVDEMKIPVAMDVMLLPNDNVTITDSAKCIFSVIAKKKDMYVFGGAIVELKKIKDQFSLSQISPAAFRSRIENYNMPIMCKVVHKDELVYKSKTCSIDSANALMASKPALELLPTIRTVTSCPILTNELQVLSKGYHEKEEILITQGKMPSNVGTSEAVEALKGLLADNDFITESDKSRALSNMISPMMKMGRFINDPCPMDTAEANKSQSGKTYRQKIIAAIYNSAPLVVTQKNGGVGSIDESIASALATGRPFIQLDNFRGNFNSPMLEAIITTPECVSIRVPRAAEQIIDASTVTFQLASNGVDTTADMANRSCITRIRKQENKQWKKWPEGDLLAHVKANQHYYLGCVIAIIKEWVNAGKRKTDTTDHDMREWAQTMDWIVQYLFKSASLLNGHKNIQKQVSNPQLTWLREVCIQAEHDEKLGFELLAHNISEICEHSDIQYPNRRKYQDDSANKYIGVIMGKIFSKDNSVIIDSYKIIKTEANIYNEAAKRHLMSKIYTIDLL